MKPLGEAVFHAAAFRRDNYETKRQRQGSVRGVLGYFGATGANVSHKPNFNSEVEINDLWTLVGNLRQAQPAGTVAALAKRSTLAGANASALTGNCERYIKPSYDTVDAAKRGRGKRLSY